jgi:hypothetical protein
MGIDARGQIAHHRWAMLSDSFIAHEEVWRRAAVIRLSWPADGSGDAVIAAAPFRSLTIPHLASSPSVRRTPTPSYRLQFLV